MTMRQLIVAVNFALAAAVLGTASASLTASQQTHERETQPTTKDVLAPPTQPLDPRIKSEKITEQEPPPLPEQVLLPLPPDHRIAADPHEVPIDQAHWDQALEAIQKGVQYLRDTQHDSGGWMIDATASPTDQPEKVSPVSVAVTAMITKAIAQSSDEAARSESIRNALQFIARARNEDGSYEGGALTNYVTSTIASALATVESPDTREHLRAAITWLQKNQWDQSEGLSPRQDWFGGAGYGNHGRPDLSNTQMMLDALYDAQLSPSEPAFQRALSFVSRTQNLQATNKAEWAGNDGGFIYTPANGGESMASDAAGEGRYGEKLSPDQPRSLRSYGSMTYAGFKSLLYAGLSPDDLRVRAAFDWIRHHYTFDENPGMGQQGLYYYYTVMSRALRVAQQNNIADADGTQHNWRSDLIDAIVKRQNDDGSWVNSADRWMEGEPALTTAYALLALEEAIKPVSMMPPPVREHKLAAPPE